MTSFRRSLLSTIVAALALAGCSSSSDEADGPRPVTDDEATRMAETLFNNYDVGGADFALTALMPDDTLVQLVGEIDWQSHHGRADVSVSSAPDAAITEVVWADDIVIERIPALAPLAAQLGEPDLEWVSRAPAPDDRHLDSMLAVVTALATEQRDNAVLIAQDPGTAWLRSDELDGTPVDVVRYGEITRYWLEAEGVTLLRFEGDNNEGSRPIVVDLSDHGPRTIEFPDQADVVDIAVISELYEVATAVSTPG